MLTARENPWLLQATLEAVEDAVLVISRDGRVTGYNQRFADLWHLPRDVLDNGGYLDALDLAIQQLKDPDSCRRRFQEIMANPMMESRDLLEFHDGRAIERFSRPQRIGAEITGRVFCYRDVSERMRHESEIELQGARARVLADASRTFSEARLDMGKVADCAVRLAAGFFSDGCLIRTVSDDQATLETVAFHHVDPGALEVMKQLLPDDHAFIDLLAGPEVLRTGKPVLVAVTPEEAGARLRQEYHAVLERYPLHSWLTVPLQVAGKITGIMTVVRFRDAPAYGLADQAFLQDLADRTALAIDNARLYLEARRAVGVREDFISIASHELRTPLTPLRSQLEMLRLFLDSGEIDAGPFGERLLALVAESDGQVARLAALVDDMLNVSRMRTGKFSVVKSWVDMSELVRHVLHRWDTELLLANCDLRQAIENGLVVFCDRMKVEQVLNNLIANVCKYAPDAPVEVTLARRGDKVLLGVRDHGAGIDEKQQERIFHRFERGESTARQGGLGLGLYIAREIVEAHGGHLRLESRPGNGACFEAEFPVGTSEALRAA